MQTGTASPYSFPQWVMQGLRAGFLLRPRVAGRTPAPWQALAVLTLFSLAEIAVARLEVAGEAIFNYRVWVASWWTLPLLALAAWTLCANSFAVHGGQPALAARSHPVLRWFVLWFGAAFPATLVAGVVAALDAHGLLPPLAWLGWALYAVLWGWLAAACFVSARSFLAPGRAVLLAAVFFGLAVTSQWLFPQPAWYAAAPQDEAAEPPRLALSQAVFERQQALWTQGIEALAPQREGIADVYAIVFAPYAQEDVFLREGTMVAQVLRERFDAAGRTLHLANHATTAASLPWATPANLRRAIDAVAARMDRENDVLVVYLTSHGAKDFLLAASHWPLEVEPVAPAMLREALDAAGIRHRVIAISACFSGGWIAPLASEHTLVMTAADATHTSYGCGRLSELTFFGRAMFDEQLRKTHSFEEAFAQAVPVIARRETEAGKQDGFSNPQISVGPAIRPVLRALERRLDGP